MMPIAWLITTTIWLTVWIPFYILGFLVTWLGLLFCNRKSEHMAWPWWFWDSNHGINGTLDFNNLNWVAICNPAVMTVRDPVKICKKIVSDQTGRERGYFNRWIWITWRNPVTNVSLYLIGKRITKPITNSTWSWGPFVYQKAKCGWLWQYSFTVKYPGGRRGFFHSFGWKFLDPSEGRARFMYRISPYRQL